MMPLPRQRHAKTAADQPPWRNLRLQLLAQKCPWLRPKSQQRVRQSGAGTKAVTAHGKSRARQSVVKTRVDKTSEAKTLVAKVSVVQNRVRRRLDLRVASRTTAAAEAATATDPLCSIRMKAKRHWTPPVMAMCWKNRQISPLTVAMSVMTATANRTETATALLTVMAVTTVTTAVSAQAELPRLTRLWKLARLRNRARASRVAVVTIPVLRSGATAGAMPAPRTAKELGQSVPPSPKQPWTA